MEEKFDRDKKKQIVRMFRRSKQTFRITGIINNMDLQ